MKDTKIDYLISDENTNNSDRLFHYRMNINPFDNFVVSNPIDYLKFSILVHNFVFPYQFA